MERYKIDFFPAKEEIREEEITSEGNLYSNLSIASMIKKGEVTLKQKQIASNYMVIKRIYGFFSVPSYITNLEKNLLAEYGFLPLEETSFEKMIQELDKLREMSNSYDKKLCLDSDKIFELRVKELKYIYTSNYFPQDEFCNGYKALEEYISYIGA